MYKLVLVAAILGLTAAKPDVLTAVEYEVPLAVSAPAVSIATPAISIAAPALPVEAPAFRVAAPAIATPVIAAPAITAPLAYSGPGVVYSAPAYSTYAATYGYDYAYDYPAYLFKKR